MRRSTVRRHARRTPHGRTTVGAHTRNRASGKRWTYLVEDQQTGHQLHGLATKDLAKTEAKRRSIESGHAMAVIAVDSTDGQEYTQGAYYGRSWRDGMYTRTFNRTTGASVVPKPKRTEYRIATRDDGWEMQKGYVLGDFGAAKGKWFWDFTHLPSGLKMVTYPVVETKDAAMAHLLQLQRGEHQPEHVRRMLADAPRLP